VPPGLGNGCNAAELPSGSRDRLAERVPGVRRGIDDENFHDQPDLGF